MTPIEQAAQALRELVALHDLRARIDKPGLDSVTPPWVSLDAKLAAQIDLDRRRAPAWAAARAALASLEAAKQEPLTDAQSMVDFARGYAAGERVALANWTKDAREYGNALNDAAWVFIETCPEKSALLFNHCKPALREAILKYAELVAAAPSPGSGT